MKRPSLFVQIGLQILLISAILKQVQGAQNWAHFHPIRIERSLVTSDDTFKTSNILSPNANSTNNSSSATKLGDSSKSSEIEQKMINESDDCMLWIRINPNEKIELAYQIARASVGVFAMVGNLLIILSVLRFNYLKKASAYYLCNMALADFLLGFVGATYYLRVSYFSKTNQITNKLSFVVYNFSVLHSMLSMVIVAADRFSYICHPLTYEAKVFAMKPYLFILLSLAWTLIIIALLTYIYVLHTEIIINYGTIFDLVYFSIAVVLLCILYGAILKVAHEQQVKDEKHKAEYCSPNSSSNNGTSTHLLGNGTPASGTDSSSKNREAKATRRVIYGYMFIVGTFTVTYIYAYVMAQIRHNLDYCDMGYDKTSWFYVFFLSSIVLQNINAACNPIVYCYCISHFRKAFRKNIVQIFTCFRMSGERETQTRSSFVLDVPDDRKSFAKKSTTESIFRNSIFANGSTSRSSPARKMTTTTTMQSGC